MDYVDPRLEWAVAKFTSYDLVKLIRQRLVQVAHVPTTCDDAP